MTRASFAAAAAPLIAFRGDLISNTGYAKAARALADLLSERFLVLGVSLEEDPADRGEVFPGTLVSDAELVDLAESNDLFVVHHMTPDNFLPVPNAFNIGAFYWETSGIPLDLQWPSYIATMDAIWAPTRFVADFVRSCDYDGPVSIIPWPHEVSGGPMRTPAARPVRAEPISAVLLDTMPWHPGDADAWPRVRLRDIRRSTDLMALAIQSLAPRKGLPVMITEWRRFVQQSAASEPVLVIKLSFRHAHGLGGSNRDQIFKLLTRYGVRPGERLRVAVIDETLSETAMQELTASADLFISASYGEGFGGPIVEALASGVPVIAPRHTGVADLLPENYPLQLSFDAKCVALSDNLAVYPAASTWCVPRPGALATQLTAFAGMSRQERGRIVELASAHAEEFCGRSRVRSSLGTFFDQHLGQPR